MLIKHKVFTLNSSNWFCWCWCCLDWISVIFSAKFTEVFLWRTLFLYVNTRLVNSIRSKALLSDSQFILHQSSYYKMLNEMYWRHHTISKNISLPVISDNIYNTVNTLTQAEFVSVTLTEMSLPKNKKRKEVTGVMDHFKMRQEISFHATLFYPLHILWYQKNLCGNVYCLVIRELRRFVFFHFFLEVKTGA